MTKHNFLNFWKSLLSIQAMCSFGRHAQVLEVGYWNFLQYVKQIFDLYQESWNNKFDAKLTFFHSKSHIATKLYQIDIQKYIHIFICINMVPI